MTFYKLEIGRTSTFVELSDANDWETIRCSASSGHQRAGRRVTPLRVDVMQRNVVDFSRTLLSDVVVTDRAVDVLRTTGLTGFLAKPAEIVMLPADVREVGFQRLWELTITGQGGPAHKDSGITLLRRCDECDLVTYSAFENGIVVDMSAYDGADFFTVKEYPKYFLATERAKTIVEGSGLTNVSFVASTRLQWPEGVARPS